MTLTPTAAAVPSADDADPAEELRSDTRFPADEAGVVSRPTPSYRGTPDPYERRDVHVINVSRHGVAFRTSCPIAAGSYVRLNVSGREREVRVQHCRSVDDGYEVGAEFH